VIISNPSIQESEAGKPKIQDQPELQRENLLQKKRTKMFKYKENPISQNCWNTAKAMFEINVK
jgi:hypothetical protein